MTTKERALATLALARNSLNALLEDIPEDKMLYSPIPGGNHALWIIGHLTAGDDFFAGMLDGQGKKLPQQYETAFGMGSKISNDPAAYPPVAEVKQHFAITHERFVQAYQAASEAALAEPLPEEMGGFVPDKLSLPMGLAFHEGLHTGQLTVIRRSLGLEPKFG